MGRHIPLASRNINATDRFVSEVLRSRKVLAEAARVRQTLHKCAHEVYKSFKPRQTGRSTEYPVSSGCCYRTLVSSSFLRRFIFLSRFLAKEQNFRPIHVCISIHMSLIYTYARTFMCTIFYRVSRNSI